MLFWAFNTEIDFYVRIAERSKVPYSRANSFRQWSILVHVCGRWLESHFWQIDFVPYIMFVYETICIQLLNKWGFLTDITYFPGKIDSLRIWMIHPGKLVPLIKTYFYYSSLIYINCVLYYANVSPVGVHYFYVCPKFYITMFAHLRHVWCYCENSIQKLYCTSGWPSGLRRQTQELSLSVNGAIRSTYVGVGSNTTSDKLILIHI